jgi:hypothetical protein
MIRLQQGFPAGTNLDDATVALVANVRRHYPAAAVGEVRDVSLPEHVAAGETLVEADVTGDMTAADLTDPAVVRRALVDRARAALNVLDPAERVEAIGGRG